MIHGVTHDALVSFLARLVGEADAEDVAAETYLAALTARTAFDPTATASVTTWVYGIAKRQAANWVRKRDRRHVAERHGPAPQAPPPADWALVLDALDPEDQAIIEAKLAEGTTAGAARRIGLTRGQMRYRWRRALRRMK